MGSGFFGFFFFFSPPKRQYMHFNSLKTCGMRRLCSGLSSPRQTAANYSLGQCKLIAVTDMGKQWGHSPVFKTRVSFGCAGDFMSLPLESAKIN